MKTLTRSFMTDFIITLGLAITVALLLRTFVVEIYQISNTSMIPTLAHGDILAVSKWQFWQFNPTSIKKNLLRRGDLVAFTIPGPSDTPIHSIRRVLGLPGDVIAVEAGHLILNHQTLPTSPLNKSLPLLEILPDGRSYSITIGNTLPLSISPQTVPDDSIFVLSDLRSEPADLSHALKPSKNPYRMGQMIPLQDLKGKVLGICLSIDPHQGVRWERSLRRPH
jgi:signal peptidase I